MALCLWLGIPVVPITPALTCSCSSYVDPYGDHLLSCPSGSYRIQRHDALRNLLHQALKQDNVNVRLEQGIDGSQQCPGDVFHPTWKDGKPTYFDVSVVNLLQPGSIIQSSLQAGVAAANREAAKDEKFDNLVTNLGGVFIPLVVESFGRWTPLACRTLKSIARRTTLRNGLQERVAYCNLCEQLSVLLIPEWSYAIFPLFQWTPFGTSLDFDSLPIYYSFIYYSLIYYSLLLLHK